MALIILFFICIGNIVANAECASSISCRSVFGDPEDTSASCNPTETLVSCGIKINATSTFISQGTEMTDSECKIIYDATNHINQQKPVPMARCCDFTLCFPANFDCQLTVKKSRSGPSDQCYSSERPHLFSCNLLQRFEPSTPATAAPTTATSDTITDTPTVSRAPSASPSWSTYDTFHGIWFSGYDGTTDNEQMKADYCQLFYSTFQNNMPYCFPTVSPTSSPTPVPIKPTEIPTNNPTVTDNPTSPSISPTTPSPTGAPELGYVYYQSNFTAPACSISTQKFNSQEYVWLYSLCCNENLVPAGAPTRISEAPTPVPTFNPTTVTKSPKINPFSQSITSTATSKVIPNSKMNSSVYFTDIGEGYVDYIHWGVSNISREVKCFNDAGGDCSKGGGIVSVTDGPTPDGTYYLTIKKYKQRSEQWFYSEYGSVYLSDDNTICSDIGSADDSVLSKIKKIHVYVNSATQKIEGMTMFRVGSNTNAVETNHTCHIAMVNDNSQEFQNQLYENDIKQYSEHTIDYSDCSEAGLAGFRGTQSLGIDSIQFEFVCCAGQENCEAAATNSPTTQSPSLSPTTPAPTKEITTASPSAENTEDYSLSCYWVMNADSAECLDTGNPSFMTACMGYSITEQPNSWYIEDDKCIVEARAGSTHKHMAAIATCCFFKDVAPEPTECEKADITWTGNENICKLAFFQMMTQWFWFFICGLALLFVIWGAVIGYYLYNRKRTKERERWMRLKAPPVIFTDRHGKKRAEFTDEQIQHKLDLDKFTVDDKLREEMVEQQKLLSDKVGLET